MVTKLNSTKSRLIILAAVPVAASLLSPALANAATQTWNGFHSNFIGTTSNWASGTPAGSNSTTSNTDLAVLPDFLSTSGGSAATNPEPIYIATTGNQNTNYYLGAFDMVDASISNTSIYEVTNNNDTAGSATVSLDLNGTTVGSAANTILADNTTSTNTTLEVGSDLGTKPDAQPLAVVIGNTGSATNNISVSTGDQIILGSSISEAKTGSSLIASGGGALTLSGANTFTGGVTVNGSILVAAYIGGVFAGKSSTGTSASNVTLNSSSLSSLPAANTYIAGSVSVGTGNNIITPGGNGTLNSVGTLDIAGALSLNASSTLDFDLSGNTSDQLNLGSLSIIGKPTINIDNASGPSGNFVLATYAANAGLSSSSFNFTNIPTGYTADVTSTEIELLATGNPANVTWNVTPSAGSVSGTWNNTSGNWTGGSPVNNLYKSGDTANFDDISGGASGLISVTSGGVQPLNTIINNSNTSYSFTDADGANGIGGGGSLTKNGNGTAELKSPNSYSNGTVINAGTLIADGDATLGAASAGITLAGGTLQAGAAIGTTVTPSQRSITVNTGGGTFNTNGFNSVTSGSAAVNDTFNVNGAGSLDIQSAIAVNAAINVNATGGLELDGDVNFNTIGLTGSINIGTGSIVTFANQNPSAIISQESSSTYNGKLVVTGTPRLNFNNNAVISGSGEIDITNPGTTDSVTVTTSGSPTVVYTTYDTGVAITNTKSGANNTAGGTIDVPIKLNTANLPFTAADVSQPNASFIPGSFTVSMGGTTAGLVDTINGVISGASDVNFANGPAGGGAGTLVLAAQNQYQGTSLMNMSGTVQLATADALPTGSNVIFGTISGAEGTNTTLDLDSNVQQIASLSSGQFGHASSEMITNYGNNPATLVIGGSVSPANKFKGTISDGIGGVSLVMDGPNTIGLSGASTYSGGTTLNGGTLVSSNDPNLGNPSGMLTFNGGKLGVTGSLTSPYLSSRPITVNSGGGTIDVAPTTSYTLSASPAIAWNGGTLNFTDTGSAMITQSGGTISVAAGSALAVAAGANLTVNGSTDPFTDNTGAPNPEHVAIVNNGALNIAQVNSTIAGITGTGTLTVGDGVTANTLALVQNGASSSLGSLAILGNSALDITNNAMFINYGNGPDPIVSIAAMIASGAYGGGTTVSWTGPGIISSTAQTNPAYGIGYADSADPGNPANLASGQIEVMYTLLGDANLDEKVNGIDFNLMATNFNQSVTAGWDKGDFNYDGKVNGNDFVLLADNFNQFAGQSAVSAADMAALQEFAAANGISLNSVPEPASLGVLTLAAVGTLTRRRRRHL